MDELELQFKKDQKDIRKYYHIQLEEGNAIFEKDLQAIDSNRGRRELKKEYRDFIRGLEKEYNREMDKLENTFVGSLVDLEEDCGYRAVKLRIMEINASKDPYYRGRPRYR